MTNQSGDVQQSFKTLVKQRRFAEIARLISTSKTQPADYIVRMGYKMYLEKKRSNSVKLFFVMKLKEITKIEPDESIIGDILKATFELHSPPVLSSICARLEIDLLEVENIDEILQEEYLYQVKIGAFTNVENLMNLTQVKPSDSIIQQAYEHYLNEGKLISFTGLKRRTGIKPDKKMVLETIKRYQEESNKYDVENASKKIKNNPWKKKIERLRKAMGSNVSERSFDI